MEKIGSIFFLTVFLGSKIKRLWISVFHLYLHRWLIGYFPWDISIWQTDTISGKKLLVIEAVALVPFFGERIAWFLCWQPGHCFLYYIVNKGGCKNAINSNTFLSALINSFMLSWVGKYPVWLFYTFPNLVASFHAM